MSDDILEEDIFVRLNFAFSAIGVVNNEFTSNSWDFTIDVLPDPDLDLDGIEITGALKKMRYWVDEILNGSLIISSSNKWAMNTFLRKDKLSIANNIVLLPNKFTEEILARVIYSKFLALSGGHLMIGPMEITKSDNYGVSLFFSGETHSLPGIEAWLGKPTFFEDPWWQRDDGSTLDLVPTSKADLALQPDYALSLDFLIKTPRPKRKIKAELIRPNFRPKVIHGGG